MALAAFLLLADVTMAAEANRKLMQAASTITYDYVTRFCVEQGKRSGLCSAEGVSSF